MRPRVSQFHNLDSFYPRNATNQNYKQLALIVGFKKMLKMYNCQRTTQNARRRTKTNSNRSPECLRRPKTCQLPLDSYRRGLSRYGFSICTCVYAGLMYFILTFDGKEYIWDIWELYIFNNTLNKLLRILIKLNIIYSMTLVKED